MSSSYSIHIELPGLNNSNPEIILRVLEPFQIFLAVLNRFKLVLWAGSLQNKVPNWIFQSGTLLTELYSSAFSFSALITV